MSKFIKTLFIFVAATNLLQASDDSLSAGISAGAGAGTSSSTASMRVIKITTYADLVSVDTTEDSTLGRLKTTSYTRYGSKAKELVSNDSTESLTSPADYLALAKIHAQLAKKLAELSGINPIANVFSDILDRHQKQKDLRENATYRKNADGSITRFSNPIVTVSAAPGRASVSGDAQIFTPDLKSIKSGRFAIEDGLRKHQRRNSF